MTVERTWNCETVVNLPDPDRAAEFHLALRELAQTMGGTVVESHVHPHPKLRLVGTPEDAA